MAQSKKRTATLARAAKREQVLGRLLEDDREYGLQLRERRGRLVVSWEIHPDPFVAVMGLRNLRAQLEGVEHELVTRLRAQGVAWDEVGWALGMSRQGAQKKYRDAEAALRRALEGDAAASG